MKRIDDVIEWVHHLFVDEIQSDTKRFGEWFVDYLGDECWVTGDGGGGSYAVIHRGDNWILRNNRNTDDKQTYPNLDIILKELKGVLMFGEFVWFKDELI